MPEIEEIWLEFEENKTPEAQFVNKLDKYHAVLQSQLYANDYAMLFLYEEFRTQAEIMVENMEQYN